MPQYIIKSDGIDFWAIRKESVPGSSRRADANAVAGLQEAAAMALQIKVYSDYV